MNKKMFSLLISIAMVFAALPATPALAATTIETSEYEIRVDNNTSIIADVPAEYQALISEQDLIDIALDEGLQDGDRINIHKVECAEEETTD